MLLSCKLSAVRSALNYRIQLPSDTGTHLSWLLAHDQLRHAFIQLKLPQYIKIFPLVVPSQKSCLVFQFY